MIRLQSPSGRAHVYINPVGAALTEILVNGTLVVGAPDQYSGVILFPWPNRIYEGRWSFDGRELQLPTNEPNAALHGLVYDREFSVTSQTDVACCLVLKFEANEGYPFDFEIVANFELTDSSVRISYTVTNKSSAVAPYALGFHPYFAASNQSRLWLNGESLAIEDVHLDTTFGPGINGAKIQTEANEISIESSDLDYFHVFTNRYDDPSRLWLAVEPQSAPANSLATNEGVRSAQPGVPNQSSVKIRWT
jgi:aldose 1-epimerase